MRVLLQHLPGGRGFLGGLWGRADLWVPVRADGALRGHPRQGGLFSPKWWECDVPPTPGSQRHPSRAQRGRGTASSPLLNLCKTPPRSGCKTPYRFSGESSGSHLSIVTLRREKGGHKQGRRGIEGGSRLSHPSGTHTPSHSPSRHPHRGVPASPANQFHPTGQKNPKPGSTSGYGCAAMVPRGCDGGGWSGGGGWVLARWGGRGECVWGGVSKVKGVLSDVEAA